LPWIGSALDIGGDLLGWTKRCIEKYGPVFGAHIAGRSYIFVTDPFAARQVLNAKASDMSWRVVRRKVTRNALMMTLSDSEFLSRNDCKSRTILNKHLLQSDNLAILLDNYQKYIKENMFPQLDNSVETLNANGWLKKGMYDFVGQIVWNATLVTLYGMPDLATKDCFEFLCKFDERFHKFGQSRFFQWRHKEQYHAREQYLSKVRESMKRRDAIDSRPAHPKPLLGIELDNWMKDCEMDIDSRSKGIAANIHASVLNSIPTAFWLLFHILENRTAYDAIVEEVRETRQVNATVAVFSADELKRMVKLDSMLTETLRLESTNSKFRLRLVERDLPDLNLPLVDGSMMQFSVKKNTIVMTCPTLMHLDEEVFENAREYKWDRFVPSGDKPIEFRKGGKLIINPVEAFGGGPVYCPGRNFARGEIKAIIALLLFEYDLRFADGVVPTKPAMLDNKTSQNHGVPAHDVVFELRPRAI
jgi:cholesterol 7alpha-monooxygenase/oxysterol 7-alpha-hydroxylase